MAGRRSIEFTSELSDRSKTWAFFTAAWKIIACGIPALLLLGFAVFFLPRDVRPWAVGVAIFGMLASMLSPDAGKWFAYSNWSLLPVITLAIALVAALAPARRRNIRLCHKCNYDLTGNVSGVCPECGTPRPLANIDTLAKNLDAIE